jgi:hypothetical protein
LDFIVVRRDVDAAESGRNRHDSQEPGAWVTTTAELIDDTTPLAPHAARSISRWSDND